MHCKHQSVTVGQIQIIKYNWCPTKLTPPMGKNPGDDDLQGQNSINGGGNCDSQASLNTGPR